MPSTLRRSTGSTLRRAAALFAGWSFLAGGGGCARRAGEPPAATPPRREAPAAPAALFIDATEAAGLDFVHFNGMTGKLYMPEHMGPGGALFDFDGDGDLDLYAAQGGLLGPGEDLARTLAPPPAVLGGRLYRNDLPAGSGAGRLPRFVDVTAESRVGRGEAGGPDPTGYGMGAAAADFDHDGRVDLYLTELGPNRLLRNRGDGTFEEVTGRAGVADPRWSVSASFVDVDGDGWLDLFVANYLDVRFAATKVCFSPSGKRDYCGPDAFEPVVNSLFRNRGDGTFEDVSERSGIRGFRGASLGVAAADFDADGRVDLYVANDKMPNELWLNRGDGTFENGAALAGVAVNADGEAEASMGVDAADCDGDGDEDLFLTHLTGETNTLYVQAAPGAFRDETRASGLGVPSWPFTAFGTGFFDYDLDGRLDLYAVDGWVEIPDAREDEGALFPLDQTNQLFHNLGGCRFEETTAAAGPGFARSEVSRGAAVGDLDDDGDPDLVVFNNNGPARVLLAAAAGGGRHWLGLRLFDAALRRDALGARARVRPPGAAPLWRRARSDGSYASARDPRVLFGLGDWPGPADVLVEWPGGARERFPAVPADRYSTLTRGTGEAAE
jgi:hypothetical protein